MVARQACCRARLPFLTGLYRSPVSAKLRPHSGENMKLPQKILLLGSGELGREFVIAAKRLGLPCRRLRPLRRRAGDAGGRRARSVLRCSTARALGAAIDKHKPDLVVPEIEAIRTETLAGVRGQGLPRRALGARRLHDHEPRPHPRGRRARAGPAHLALSLCRVAARDARRPSARSACPCVVKPVMSSARARARAPSRPPAEIEHAWDYAVANMRGDRARSSSRNSSPSTTRSPC